jgi:hypothetical protein
VWPELAIVCCKTDPAPADSPYIVTLDGLPPNFATWRENITSDRLSVQRVLETNVFLNPSESELLIHLPSHQCPISTRASNKHSRSPALSTPSFLTSAPGKNPAKTRSDKIRHQLGYRTEGPKPILDLDKNQAKFRISGHSLARKMTCIATRIADSSNQTSSARL